MVYLTAYVNSDIMCAKLIFYKWEGQMFRHEIPRKLNATLERLTGCAFGEQYISTDKNEFVASYIPPEGLLPGHPVIISHYLGVRMVFIPHEDWNALIKRKTTVEDYVNNSIWNYGYYWGFDGLQNGGVFWQPLEEGNPGINDRKKIKRYLTILRCRAFEKHRNESPMMIWCSDCYLEKCPMSVVARKRVGVTWDDEIQERNVRHEFYAALAVRIQKRFNLEACMLGFNKTLDSEPKNIYLLPGFTKNTVKIFISQAMFVDMMYHPEKYDIEKLLKKCKLVACVDRYDNAEKEFVIDKTKEITEKTGIAELNEFWGRK